MIKIVKVDNYDKLSEKAAEIICEQVQRNKYSVLGLATGASPVGTYKKIVDKYKRIKIDFSRIYSVNLDEYKGIGRDNPDGYYYYMCKNFFDQININPEHILFPNGMADDAERECHEYDEKIKAVGGIDLQLLGIGVNGHIGFNEPCDYFEKGTHVVKLSESTKAVNKKYFKHTEILPEEAFTMGIGNILSAKKILLIASGSSKSECLKKAILGPVTPHVPASILQFHDDVTIVADKEALSGCRFDEDETYI